MSSIDLRNKIIDSLNTQGFSVNGHVEPTENNKESFRKIHAFSKREQLNFQKDFLENSFNTVSKYLVDGKDIDPSKIDLEFRIVQHGTVEHKIFRWWNLVWWSVPYQRAYGRQMRLLIWDKAHDCPFGIIGLQSPILKMSVRDKYLKIPTNSLDLWINKSMQAQRLGALPPYNRILGGKMVAMALTANELRLAYKRKYENIETLLTKRVIDADLLFLTTTSAFGRSSIYNRLKFNDEWVAKSLGFTKGAGTFHIPQNLYLDILQYLSHNSIDTGTTFGNGPSRKIKLLNKAFSMLDLPKYHFHNIQREFFLFPLVKNLLQVISDEQSPVFFDRSLQELADFWKTRWCEPRAERFNDFYDFKAKEFLENICKEASIEQSNKK